MKCLCFEGGGAAVEARALEFMRYVSHPHLLPAFGIWHRGEYLVIGMELADRTLAERLLDAVRQELPGIPFGELLEYMREAATAIDFLNEARHTIAGKNNLSIIHRDIKPRNLLLVGGSVKVADFGLARAVERTTSARSGGMTVAYAAPEFFHRQVSRHSDQYSLAISYCELRGGRVPFAGSPVEVMAGHLTQSPDLGMVPEQERGIVARALAKLPQARWPSCRDFVQGLSGAQARAGTMAPASVRPSGTVAPGATAEEDRVRNEAEWMTCATPSSMLQHLRGRASGRKLRLFACACCRRVWHLLIDPRSRQAVAVAEDYAEGLIPEDAREAAHTQARAARDALLERKRTRPEAGLSAAHAAAAAAVMAVTDTTYLDHPASDAFDAFAVASIQVAFAVAGSRTADGLSPDPLRVQELRSHCQLIRDIAGNPFRVAAFDRTWRTDRVIALGRHIYEDLAFDSLPLLGDALEEAGCTDADILHHCREPGEHVRGCWVVDLILSKGR
jgi:hypothetical protein